MFLKRIAVSSKKSLQNIMQMVIPPPPSSLHYFYLHFYVQAQLVWYTGKKGNQIQFRYLGMVEKHNNKHDATGVSVLQVGQTHSIWLGLNIARLLWSSQ